MLYIHVYIKYWLILTPKLISILQLGVACETTKSSGHAAASCLSHAKYKNAKKQQLWVGATTCDRIKSVENVDFIVNACHEHIFVPRYVVYINFLSSFTTNCKTYFWLQTDRQTLFVAKQSLYSALHMHAKAE